MTAHLIFYVGSQEKAVHFYRAVLASEPRLDVPGMTEFALGTGAVLGLMPEEAIKLLLGPSLPDPTRAKGIPRAELYLYVDDYEGYHRRALSAGARELSPPGARNWGDDAAYSLDPDGHVLAFARRHFRSS